MERVYLVGYMGVGKSTVGRKLAELMDFGFIDLDDLFESTYKISMDSFFAKYGEKLFRELEYKLLHTTFKMNKSVISTGGGTPCQFDAMDHMNKNGLTIFLDMPEAAIVHRLTHAKRKRPLVAGKQQNELKEFVGQHLSQRMPFYAKAKITKDAVSINVQELSEEVKKMIK